MLRRLAGPLRILDLLDDESRIRTPWLQSQLTDSSHIASLIFIYAAWRLHLGLDAKAHVLGNPECDLRLFGWRVMVPINIVADEETHGRTDKGIGWGVPAARYS